GVVMAADVIVNKLAGVEMPERLGSVGWGVFYVAGGVIAFVFLIIKWLNHNNYVKFGFYISILASLGLAVGGFLTARERGDLAALQNRGAGGTGGTGRGTTPAAEPRPSTRDRRDPRPRTGVARVRRCTPPGRTSMTETTVMPAADGPAHESPFGWRLSHRPDIWFGHAAGGVAGVLVAAAVLAFVIEV